MWVTVMWIVLVEGALAVTSEPIPGTGTCFLESVPYSGISYSTLISRREACSCLKLVFQTLLISEGLAPSERLMWNENGIGGKQGKRIEGELGFGMKMKSNFLIKI